MKYIDVFNSIVVNVVIIEINRKLGCYCRWSVIEWVLNLFISCPRIFLNFISIRADTL